MVGCGGGAGITHGALARVNAEWQVPRWSLPEPQSVLVLCTRLGAPALSAAEVAAALPADEQVRLQRLHREADRQRSALAHAMVRLTLAALHGDEPARLPIVRDEVGKPSLSRPEAADSPGAAHFSIAHSGDVVVVAFCRDHPVGVDVEQVNDAIACDAIAEQMWHAREKAWWRTLPPEERGPAFFRLWTAKEATVKALGLGVDRSPDVAVEWLTEGGCARAELRELPGGETVDRWQLTLADDPEYPLSVLGKRGYPVHVRRV